MLTWWQIGWESAKLIAQFGGALVIARLAVQWALQRYKSEKVWERQVAAYAEATTAIAEMRRIVGQWFDEAIGPESPSAEIQQVRRERHAIARRSLDEGIATARLLLPVSTYSILSALEKKLVDNRECVTYAEFLDENWGALNEAFDALVAEGRRVVGMP